MAAISEALRSMISGAKKAFFAAAGLSLLLPAGAQAQLLPVNSGSTMGSGTNLSTVMYFEPPNDQHIEMRMSGSEMSPLPGVALYDVKNLKIEKYQLDGKLEAVAKTPECTYAPLDGLASSAGHLDLLLGDGKIHLQGEGFLWQRDDQLLIVSNHVQTVIKMGTWKLTTP
ncbi:MAG TPA: hypothetical protein VH251_09745 [Verrucomicrobiae bacterium]|jgi:hypothetical protein|nr:hypothetical protein [Verrucomicrobiae bacterium]